MGNIYDIVFEGFGPATIAFAVAVENEIRSGKLSSNYSSKIIFLEFESFSQDHNGNKKVAGCSHPSLFQ